MCLEGKVLSNGCFKMKTFSKHLFVFVWLIVLEIIRTTANSCDTATRQELAEIRFNSLLHNLSADVESLQVKIKDHLQMVDYTSKESNRRWEERVKDENEKFIQMSNQAETYLTEIRANQDRYSALTRRKEENVQKINVIQRRIERLRRVCLGREPEKCPSGIVGTDCADVFHKGGRRNGIYFIKPSNSFTPFPAYCDQEKNGGGWTYIHSHINDDFDFNRSWLSYKHGFGNVSCDGRSNFWIGNEALHVLTSLRNYHLRADIMDWSKNEGYATYTSFHVGPEKLNYRLQISGYTAAEDMDIGDAFGGSYFGHEDDISYTKHDGMNFSTFDRDNDRFQYNCASQDGGGWWFNKCSAVNLNGRIYEDGFYTAADTKYGFDNGMIWGQWTGLWYALKSSNMKIRPSTFLDNV